MNVRVIDGCPAPASIAPYIYLVRKRAGQTCNSIYRGEDVAAILHAHGKHTQQELYDTLPPGQADKPGTSTHELRCDGVAYRGDVGRHLKEWQVGVDSGQDTDHDREAIDAAAKYYGWRVFHAYDAGSERHHWNFRRQPRARGARRLLIIAIRARLPRR